MVIPLSLPVYHLMALTVDGEKIKGQVMSDPAWPTHEHVNKEGERERGSFLHFPEDWEEGTREPWGLGGNCTQSGGHMSTTAQQHLRAPGLFQSEGDTVWLPGTWLGPGNPKVEPCEKQLTFQSKSVTRKKACFQEHLAPWARCRFVPVTSGSHLQIGYQQVRGAVTGNFIDGIGFTNYPQNTLKWNIKYSPFPSGPLLDLKEGKAKHHLS